MQCFARRDYLHLPVLTQFALAAPYLPSYAKERTEGWLDVAYAQA
jgi:hypothetical protein